MTKRADISSEVRVKETATGVGAAKEAANKASAINIFFILFLAGGICYASWTGQMKAVADQSAEAAKSAVALAIDLIGIMAFWLGLMRVLEAGGLMQSLARGLNPLLRRIFPDVPENHPAMGAITLSVAANMLGLGNAATPLGIKAITELNKLNPIKGTNSNSMCLFLVITASSITLLPLGTINVRAAAGCSNPAAIFLPTLFATTCSTLFGVLTALWLAKRDRAYPLELAANTSCNNHSTGEDEQTPTRHTSDADFSEAYKHLSGTPSRFSNIMGYSLLILCALGALSNLLTAPSKTDFIIRGLFSTWLMPMIMLLVVVYGMIKGVRIYEAVTEGAKQGFEIAIRIIPYLVTILVSIAAFRASGAMELLTTVLSPLTTPLGLPPNVLPMAIVRPLSGSGAFAIMADIIKQGPDSYEALVASTIMGCTETSFYILAVYCGAVGVFRVRHALPASLVADLAGIVAASLICSTLL